MKRVSFILDGFELQSPGQQLLDRFLLGWNEDGEFKRSEMTVTVSLPESSDDALLSARQSNFGLQTAKSVEAAMENAGLVIIAPGTTRPAANQADQFARRLNALPKGKTYYIDAALALNHPSPKWLAEVETAGAKFLISRAAAHFIPLPVRPRFSPSRVEKALIVVQGGFPEAELDALYALASYLPGKLFNDKSGANQPASVPPSITALRREKVWDFACSSEWTPLLAAVVSRSNTIKGDPEKDGRTQDIVGLHLIEKLAANPRGWRLQLSGLDRKLELAILVLDGAFSDFNLAVAENGRIHSAQLYEPPAPSRAHYDALASWIVAESESASPEGNAAPALFLNRLIAQMLATGA